MPSAAVFVLGSSAPGAALSAFLNRAELSLQDVQLGCAAEASPQAGSAPYEVALLAPSPGMQVNSQVLASISRALAPGAVLYVYAEDVTSIQALQKDLLLGGYLGMETLPGEQLVRARKPTWEVGAKAALSLKRPAAAAAPAAPSQAWKVAAGGNGEDELVDEDELLTEEDKRAGPTPVAAGDCSTSRKACKNCSCGRAEQEAAGEKVQLTQAMLDNPQTNCGSCALGDAFRCAGCPYRGLPSFEPGKKITLSADFLTADA